MITHPDSPTLSQFDPGSVLTIPREFVAWTGTVEKALFITQLVYWADRCDGHTFARSSQEWSEEIGLSDYTIRQAIRWCQEEGFLSTETKRFANGRMLHYTVDRDTFRRKLAAFRQKHPTKTAPAYRIIAA